MKLIITDNNANTSYIFKEYLLFLFIVLHVGAAILFPSIEEGPCRPDLFVESKHGSGSARAPLEVPVCDDEIDRMLE